MTRWGLWWGRQTLQTRTIYWLLRQSSAAARTAPLGQTQVKAAI